MPFGLTNILVSFQGYVNKNLAKKLDFLDDILIYTEDLGQDYIEAVWWFLEVIKKYSVYTNLKKCCFQDEIRFLGFVVFTNRIQIEGKIKTVKK